MSFEEWVGVNPVEKGVKVWRMFQAERKERLELYVKARALF